MGTSSSNHKKERAPEVGGAQSGSGAPPPKTLTANGFDLGENFKFSYDPHSAVIVGCVEGGLAWSNGLTGWRLRSFRLPERPEHVRTLEGTEASEAAWRLKLAAGSYLGRDVQFDARNPDHQALLQELRPLSATFAPPLDGGPASLPGRVVSHDQWQIERAGGLSQGGQEVVSVDTRQFDRANQELLERALAASREEEELRKTLTASGFELGENFKFSYDPRSAVILGCVEGGLAWINGLTGWRLCSFKLPERPEQLRTLEGTEASDAAWRRRLAAGGFLGRDVQFDARIPDHQAILQELRPLSVTFASPLDGGGPPRPVPGRAVRDGQWQNEPAGGLPWGGQEVVQGHHIDGQQAERAEQEELERAVAASREEEAVRQALLASQRER